MTTALLEGTTRQELWAGRVVDCDVHANIPSVEALFPYLADLWVQWIRERSWHGPAGVSVMYPPGAPSTARPEWRPEGKPPASELALLREHILDPWQVEYAVVNCYYAVDSLRHPDLAIALASAVNDYLVDTYLDKDPRLVASLVLPARDPAAMIREIERIGDHPGFVQALFPVRNDRLWGQRIWHPVYEALVERDLVLGLHFGGTTEAAPSPTGYASWYVEEYAAEWQAFAAQVTSLIAEGVFQVLPKLRVAVLEGGFTWVPVWGWRMNKEWKALRREIPWVDRLPLDILRDHMRFSIAPIDAGPPEQMAKVIEWLGDENLLMFATDYPHTHDDDIGAFLSVVPEPMREKVMSETAREWYRLPARGGSS
jgi:predicted TIM-barrel fold metal-dependent hydrolase